MGALAAVLEILEPHLRDSNRALIAAKCIGLMHGYDRKWRDAPYLIDDVECVVTSELRNVETNARSRTFGLAGKIDVRAREVSTGARVLIDHKTTSQDISDPSATYWRQLVIDGQVSHYFLLEWMNGNSYEYGLWDVVRKPTISPKLLAKKEREVIYITGRYCDKKLSPAERNEIAASERETPWMYSLRVIHDCAVERPEWYFQRRQVPRMDADIYEYAVELWGHAKDLIAARHMNRHPRNSGACMNYGSPCKFLGICSGYDTADSSRWVRRAQVHDELPGLVGDGRNVLTTSRIRTFQLCRRKHELQYEIGIEKVDDEERESLWFGTLFHEALEAYFLQMKAEQIKGAAA